MISAPNAILNTFGSEHRRVLSRWRALVYLRRASRELPPEERRWSNIPSVPQDMDSLLSRMQASGQIESISHAPGCYAVTTPFARTLPIREEELLLELNPFAVFTHYTALAFHGFTQNRPNVLTAWPGTPGWAIPLGTTDEDWIGLNPPVSYRPSTVLSQEVQWFRRYQDYSFGVTSEYSGPIQIRITDQERTLIESLQWPSYAGGIGNVIQAWDLARSFINIDAIVDYSERYDINLLRQRVGFVAELMGFSHHRFDTWAARSHRGGSSRLVGSRPFASGTNARWNLSINAPVEALLA